MAAGDLITIKNAIPMIMGANIGTSVTNTLVSLGSFVNKDANTFGTSSDPVEHPSDYTSRLFHSYSVFGKSQMF